MHGKLLLRISAVTAYFRVDATAVSCKWIITWAEPTWWSTERNCRENLLRRKYLWKTNVNDTDREDQVTERVTPKCFKNMHGRNFKRTMKNFQ